MVKRKSVSPVMEQYFELKEAHPDCLLFFRMGDFYELFFQDAERAAQILGIALTKRGKMDDQDIPMCGVPADTSETYVARLVHQGLRVAVCEQMETPSKASKGPLKRDVVRIVTPGTLTEDTLIPAKRNTYLVAVCPQNTQIGLAAVDLSTGAFWVEQVEGEGLERTLYAWEPREVLAPQSWAARLSSWHVTPVPDERVHLMQPDPTLHETWSVKSLEGFGAFSDPQKRAMAMAIDYIRLTQKNRLPSLMPPRLRTQNDFLEIDPSTARNLELTQTASGTPEGSLLWAIDRTVTAAGGRMLFARLTRPLLDPALINQRLDQVAWFVQNGSARQTVRTLFKRWPDLERIIARLSLRRGTPRDLAGLRDGLALLPALAQAVLHEPIDLHTTLAQHLARAISTDLPVTLREGGVLASGYDTDLDGYRTARDQGTRSTHALQDRYIQETGIPTLKIRRNDIMGYYIEVSAA